MATRTYTFSNGQTADGGQVETEINEIFTNITNSNVASGAAIAYSKLNLTGAVVNADINSSAAIAISKTALGTYTADATWGPTLSATGSMTFTGTTINIASWRQLGKRVEFYIDCEGTTGGTASTAITFTLPVTSHSIFIGGGAFVTDGLGVVKAGCWAHSGTGNVINVYKADGSNWGLGANRRFIINASYQVD